MEVNNISCSSADSTKDDDVMLPGFRFHPTDEELVGFYLKRKVDKKPFSIELIRQIDIYKYDPWDLPKTTTAGDKEWYFFCIRGRKYRNSVRPNRVTKSGFWKATGIDKPIYSVKEPHECIGLKKSLVYYRGSAGKGTKTDWMMHEFRLPPDGYGKNSDQLLNAKINIAQEAEVWTLCRIFKRASSYKRYTPDWKETNHRQNLGNSNSKTCSLESETSEKYLTFGDSCNGIRQNECKPVNHLIDQGSIMFMDTSMNSITQPSPMATYSSFYHPYTGEVFDNGNWDELSSVVELANGNSPFQFQFQGYRCT